MLKKEINNIELSVENPYEIQLVNIPAGIYRLRIIHQSRAVFDRPRSLFFTFDIPGLTPQEIRDLLGLKDISAQNGVFAYAGGGEEKAGFYLQELELNVTQELSLLILGIKTFLQHIDISIDILQLSLLSSFNNDYVEVPSNKAYSVKDNDGNEKVRHAYIDLLEINSISFAPFTLTMDAPKCFYLKNLKKGSYSFVVEHQNKKVFSNYKNLFISFEIPGIESLEQTKDILGLKSISPVNGVFTYLGEGIKDTDSIRNSKDITIKEDLEKLVIKVNTFLKSDLTINELYIINDKSSIDRSVEGDTDKLSKSVKKEGEELNSKEEIPQNLYLGKGDIHYLYEVSQKENLEFVDLVATSEVVTHNKNIDYRLLILIDCFDENGNKVDKIPGIGISAAFQKPFKYFSLDPVEVEGNFHKRNLKLELPLPNSKYRIYIAAVGLNDGDRLKVDIKQDGDNKSSAQHVSNSESVKVLTPIERNFPAGKSISELNVACILDEFTTECLRHEVNLIPLGKESWIEEVSSVPIDFLLVESCWRGNNGEWGTLTKGSGGAGKLSGLLKYCKDHQIPTVFWNKEDPPHYDKFASIARLFDLVFTTDINMIPSYKKDYGIDVFSLSFAAQPLIHNPKDSSCRIEKAVFAGSYYKEKHKRCRDFDLMMNQVIKANVDYDIYDRNHERNIDKFEFPEKYKGHILGCLPAEDIWKIHKGYKYQINMNSVQNSETMFARRVYESLASGTPVLSNDSIGVRNLFGDIVLFSEDERYFVDKLIELEKNKNKYQETAKKGVRKVMREHTYAHRIKKICDLLDIKVTIKKPEVVMAFNVSNESEIELAKSLFFKQKARNKKLFIEMNNFESAHKFLNKSNSSIMYSMDFARGLYQNVNDYYGASSVYYASFDKHLESDALEDFLYWGEQ